MGRGVKVGSSDSLPHRQSRGDIRARDRCRGQGRSFSLTRWRGPLDLARAARLGPGFRSWLSGGPIRGRPHLVSASPGERGRSGPPLREYDGAKPCPPRPIAIYDERAAFRRREAGLERPQAHRARAFSSPSGLDLDVELEETKSNVKEETKSVYFENGGAGGGLRPVSGEADVRARESSEDDAHGVL